VKNGFPGTRTGKAIRSAAVGLESSLREETGNGIAGSVRQLRHRPGSGGSREAHVGKGMREEKEIR